MTNCFTKFISFLLIPAAMLVLSYPLQAEAKGKKGGFEASLVPVGEPTFTDGAIRIKAKGGRVKGGLRNVDFPVETSGVFVITLMVNDGESVDVELPFEVREGDDEGEDGEASNFVKLKVSLQEELELENGDIVKVLGVQVKMAVDEELTPIATLGFAFEARERKGGDLEPTEPEEPETSATRNDFVGVWEGAVEFEDEGETKTAAVTVDLSLSGDSLVGTMSSLVLDEEEPDTRNIAGTVTNGTLTFDILVSEEDRDDPNCANWDASATATLDASLTTMNINLFGTFCGKGGGDFEAFEFDLTKQIGALNTPNTG